MKHDLLILAKEIHRMRIEHRDYLEGLKTMKEIWDHTLEGMDLNAVALIGEPGTGKTTLTESLINDHPRQRTAEGLKIPVLYVKLPHSPNIKNTLGAILIAMEDPLPNKGTIFKNIKLVSTSFMLIRYNAYLPISLLTPFSC